MTRILTNGGNYVGSGAPLSLEPIGQRSLRMPDGVVLRGVNTTSYNTTVREQWGSAWSLPFMKRQIDNSVAVGANAVRITCSVYGASLGNYTTAELVDRYGSILGYAQDQGLLVYPCAGGVPSSMLTDAPAFQAFLTALGEWVSYTSAFESVIGFDGVNEPAAQFSQVTPPHQIAAMLASMREVYDGATTLPTTFDRVVFHNYQWAGDLGHFLDPIVDFVDVHAYTEGELPSVAGAKTLMNTKEGRRPVLIGEFGTNMATPSVDRAAYYTAVKNIVESDKRIMGAFAWAAIDTADTPDQQWGLFSGSTNTERPDITNIFRTFPTSR